MLGFSAAVSTSLPLQVRVKKAAYVKSSVSLEQCPKPKLPEFAVIGRSNVGKSSLINMLTGQGALAKVSKTPGASLVLRMSNKFAVASEI